MPRYFGFCCGCVWDYIYGHLSKEEWDAHISTIDKLINGEYSGADTFLSITYSTYDVTADQRKQLLDFFQSKKGDHGKIKGRAIVVDSLVTRAAILSFMWILMRSFDIHVFALPQPAFEWLATQSEQFNAKEVRKEIRNKVPSKHLWEKV